MEREIDATNACLFTRVRPARPATSEKETPKRKNNHDPVQNKDPNSLSSSHLPFQTLSRKWLAIITTEETTTEKIKNRKSNRQNVHGNSLQDSHSLSPCSFTVAPSRHSAIYKDIQTRNSSFLKIALAARWREALLPTDCVSLEKTKT